MVGLTDVYFENEIYSKSWYYIKVLIDEYNAVYWRKLGNQLKLSLLEEAVSLSNNV